LLEYSKKVRDYLIRSQVSIARHGFNDYSKHYRYGERPISVVKWKYTLMHTAGIISLKDIMATGNERLYVHGNSVVEKI